MTRTNITLTPLSSKFFDFICLSYTCSVWRKCFQYPLDKIMGKHSSSAQLCSLFLWLILCTRKANRKLKIISCFPQIIIHNIEEALSLNNSEYRTLLLACSTILQINKYQRYTEIYYSRYRYRIHFHMLLKH